MGYYFNLTIKLAILKVYVKIQHFDSLVNKDQLKQHFTVPIQQKNVTCTIRQNNMKCYFNASFFTVYIKYPTPDIVVHRIINTGTFGQLTPNFRRQEIHSIITGLHTQTHMYYILSYPDSSFLLPQLNLNVFCKQIKFITNNMYRANRVQLE